jgi:hypothetical protein
MDHCQCLGTIQAPGNDVALYLIPCNTDQTFWGAWEIQPGDNPTVKLSGTKYAGTSRKTMKSITAECSSSAFASTPALLP